MPVVFALARAKAIDSPIAYFLVEHHKISKPGIRAISDDPFSCGANGLFQFLREVQGRVMEMGWMDRIQNVDTNPGPESDPEEDNLLENYGVITLEQVILSERAYISSAQQR
jgi:hypothetical protein